jgi:hypothetical protein
MYKGFHHEAGTALALKMTDQLALMDKASPYTRPTDAAAAKAFCEISIYTCRRVSGREHRHGHLSQYEWPGASGSTQSCFVVVIRCSRDGGPPLSIDADCSTHQGPYILMAIH